MSARNVIPSAPRETSRSPVIRNAIEIAETMASEAKDAATRSGVTGAALALMVGAGMSVDDAADAVGVDAADAEALLTAHRETLAEHPHVARWWERWAMRMPSLVPAVAS